MAGIGFRLKKYFEGDEDFFGNLKGTLYSVVISSGPWLISVLTIALISIYAQFSLNTKEIYILKSIICYSFSVSLVVFGAIEMPLTRFLADRLYVKDKSIFRTTFMILACFVTVLGCLIGYLFYFFFNFETVFVVACIALFVAIMLIWLSMVFLSAAKNYHQIVVSFLIGGSLSVLLAFVFGRYYDFVGFSYGYITGQLIIAVSLARCLFFEFEEEDFLSFDFTNYFSRFRILIFVGLFYYLGIWIDKYLFWFSDLGEHVEGLFYTNQFYDTATFLAYLTIVPTLTIFLVKVETNFYVQYSYFYKSIEAKNNLGFLEDSIMDMIDSLRETILALLKVQTLVTILIWYFSEEVMIFLRLPSLMEPIFKYSVLGAYFQALFLVMNIVILYFNEYKKVLFHYFYFMVSNTFFTYLTLDLGPKFHGLGYLLSTFTTFMISYYNINRVLGDIGFLTFMTQPLSKRNFSEQL